MSAAELREAAKVLRERALEASAEAAPPWTPIGQLIQSDNGTEIPTSPEDTGKQDDVTDYIATMHPGVGLDLADWLDEGASGYLLERGYMSDKALDIARKILGGAS